MNDQAVRNHLITLLQGKGARMPFDDAVADFPLDKINVKPPNMTYSFWHLVEHLRIAQWDILDYINNPDYVTPEWPKDYWPDPDAKATKEDWSESIAQFKRDLQAIQELVADPEVDLTAQIPHAMEGHTVLREALLVADHNSYHIGELCILRQIVGAWPEK